MTFFSLLHRNSFRFTGPLCGESTSHWWIPPQKPINAVLWCYLSSYDHGSCNTLNTDMLMDLCGTWFSWAGIDICCVFLYRGQAGEDWIVVSVSQCLYITGFWKPAGRYPAYLLGYCLLAGISQRFGLLYIFLHKLCIGGLVQDCSNSSAFTVGVTAVLH